MIEVYTHEVWRKTMASRHTADHYYDGKMFFVQQQKGIKKRWQEYEKDYGAGFTYKKWWYKWGWPNVHSS